MLGYLKKFNSLPDELKKKVSSSTAMAVIAGLERKYQLPLASLIMRVMVREIAITDLASFLVKENLTSDAAERLAKELKEKIFFSVEDYLSPSARPAAPERKINQPAAQAVLSERREEPREAPQIRIQESVLDEREPTVRGASFFFSPEDEKEIRDLANKVNLAEQAGAASSQPSQTVEDKLAEIINRTQINFGSADLAGRFKQILKTYLRGIRNRLETELTLVKPFASGGLSFDEDSARKVMIIADKVLSGQSDSSAGSAKEIIKLPPRIKFDELEKIEESKSLEDRDVPYDFSKLAKIKKVSGPVNLSSEDISHELAPLTPAVVSSKSQPTPSLQKKEPSRPVKNMFNAKSPAPLKKTPPVEPSSPATAEISQMPLIKRRFEAENLSQNQKAKVEDVKYVPRVMSPLDELKYLDLINFRRLDKDPSLAVNKIKNKISLLEEEGYGKRLEAIKLWRSSPLNRLYLEIGHLSISENKPVDVIIKERISQAGDYLTAAEFQAIMDLNKSLRF